MSLRGVTVDTGFLVALERSKQRAIELAALASTRNIRVTLPVAVLAEWWRGGRRQARYLKGFDVESMTERLAKTAGEAMAAVPGSTVVDAIVMASAAQRDDVVYTSDVDDFARLRDQHFRGVRVLAV
jgi:predicted nucleic acid-binding protein